MRLLWLSHNVPYPPIGGVLQRNYNLVKEVASRHDVHLVAFNQKALLPTTAHLEDATKVLSQFCARVTILPIPSDASGFAWYALVIKSFLTEAPYTVNWLKSPTMRDKLRKVVAQSGFDLVHYDTISLAEYYDDTGAIPKVLNHHNVESAMMLRRARNEPNILKKLYFYREGKKLDVYERTLCPKYAANLVVSDREKHMLEQTIPGRKIELVPNGVDTEYYCPGSGATLKHTLLFSGRLDSYSNRAGILFFLKRVWPHLKRQIPDVKLTVLGKNPPPVLQRVARREANVTVTGFVSDARPYFDAAELYICPLWDGGGTRLKILDAMAMAKAVVSTSIGCEGIEVAPERNILIANSPGEFIYQIRRVLHDPNLRMRLGREARKLVTEKYAWSMIAKNLCNTYEALCRTPFLAGT